MKRLLSAVLVLVFAVAASSQESKPAPAPTANVVAGIVVDSTTGHPIAGATVVIAPVSNRQQTRSVRSDDEGRFRFTDLANGKYMLAASHRRYPMQAYEEHQDYSSAVFVGPGTDSSNINFRLRREASIRGTVVDDYNEPVANATVWLLRVDTDFGTRNTRLVRQNSTDDQGEFSFPHLEEGNYHVAVMGRPWYASSPYMTKYSAQLEEETRERIEQETAALDVAYPLTFYGGVTDDSQARPLELHYGETASVDFTLRAVPSIHLTFRQSAPQPSDVREGENAGGGSSGYGGQQRGPWPRIQLSRRLFGDLVIPAQLGISASTPGVFDITGVTPGRYLAEIQSFDSAGPHSSTQELDITGDMELSLTGGSPSATINGIVQFDGRPLTDTVVQLTNPSARRYFGARIEADRTFHFKEQVPPGKYQLGIGSRDGFVRDVTVTGASITGRSIEIGPAANVRIAMTIGQGFGEITGTALFKDEAMAGAMVILVPKNLASTMLFRRDQSDSDGTFTLSNIVPGQYTLIALKDAWKQPWADPKFLTQFLRSGETIEVVSGSKLKVSPKIQTP